MLMSRACYDTPLQGHSDFLIKVHGFPDLLSWSFPDGVSGLVIGQ